MLQESLNVDAGRKTRLSRSHGRHHHTRFVIILTPSLEGDTFVTLLYTMESLQEKLIPRLSVFQDRGPEVSRFRQFLNFLGCLLILPLYYVMTAYTAHPLTLDILLTIFAAELNRFVNERRRRRLYGVDNAASTPDAEKAIQKLANSELGPDCMAAVVGYREDPELFARALESYKSTRECRFLLVGIDGDEAPDMEMIKVFQHVCSPTFPREIV